MPQSAGSSASTSETTIRRGRWPNARLGSSENPWGVHSSAATFPSGSPGSTMHLLRPYLMNRGDLTDFYHRQFRLAASKVYMNDPEDRRRVHGELADYFE